MSVVSQAPPSPPPTRAADLGWGGSSALGTGDVAVTEAGWGFAAGSRGGLGAKSHTEARPRLGAPGRVWLFPTRGWPDAQLGQQRWAGGAPGPRLKLPELPLPLHPIHTDPPFPQGLHHSHKPQRCCSGWAGEHS